MLIYFARDIGHLVATWFRGFRDADGAAHPGLPAGLAGDHRHDPDRRCSGVLFEDQIQTAARNLWLIATTLIVFGLLLGLAERVGRQRVELQRDARGRRRRARASRRPWR